MVPSTFINCTILSWMMDTNSLTTRLVTFVNLKAFVQRRYNGIMSVLRGCFYLDQLVEQNAQWSIKVLTLLQQFTLIESGLDALLAFSFQSLVLTMDEFILMS